MNNSEYMKSCAHSFRIFLAHNYEEFKKDPAFMLRTLERVAHDIGAGIRKDGTEHDAVTGSYSGVLVTAFMGLSTGIPVNAKTWCGWLWERVGRAYE